MRALGQNTTDEVLDEALRAIDQDGNGVIDWNEFLEIMVKFNLESDLDDDIADAFRTLDRERTGLIKIADVRTVLNGLDKTLSKDEVRMCSY